MTRASVIVVGHGPEPRLGECISSVLREMEPTDELVLVDNGVTDLAAVAQGLPENVTVVGDGTNLGFGAGCNIGVAATSGQYLIFLNSDALMRPGAVSAFVQALADRSIGIVTGSLRIEAQRDRINSAGNPMHFLGITWAGGLGEPADRHGGQRDVATATGAFFAMRHTLWDELGGFDPLYFMYHEDADLSLRCWLSGHRVVYVPEAVADHDYSFTRNPLKMHLLERNRLVTVFSDYPAALLRRVLPAVIATEPLLLVLAVAQGWGWQKATSWGWLARHSSDLRQRRRRIQAAGVQGARISVLLTDQIVTAGVTPPPGMSALNGLLRVYWRVFGPPVKDNG